MEELLKQCVSLFKDQAKSKKIDLVLDLDGSNQKHFYNDAERIRQVLITVLSNAVKFTHEGVVKLIMRQVEADRIEISI